MTIHKTIAALIAALMLSTFLPLTLAEDIPTVTLGDGAPIPYLSGFNSRLIKDSAMMPGVTGKADLFWRQADSRGTAGQSYVNIQVQNIALTDDALAVFYRAEYPEILPLEYGKAQPSYDEAAPILSPNLNGDPLPIISLWREGRPDGDKAMLCLAVYSLKTPIPDQATLDFDVSNNGYIGNNTTVTSFFIDKSEVRDATIATDISLPLSMNYERYPKQKTEFEFTVKRLSFGPFGNRLHYLMKDKGRESGVLNCLLEDEQGKPLPIRSVSNIFNYTASPLNPMEMHNEIWFFGGENSKAIRVVPVKILSQDEPLQAFHTLRLDEDFPVTLPLENGYTLTIHEVTKGESGFTISYSSNSANTVSFKPGDDQGQQLDNLFYVTSNSFDIPSQSFLTQGLWMAEHKGQPISRASEQVIKEFTTLLISSFAQDHEIPLPELAVQVPLK